MAASVPSLFPAPPVLPSLTIADFTQLLPTLVPQVPHSKP